MSLFETRKKLRKRKKGFTLIEIMLVIAVIGMIAIIVGSAIDIPLLFVSSRDAMRNNHAKVLENAMYQHLIDQWEIANQSSIPEGEDNAKDICREGIVGDSSCVSLDVLVPEFLPSIPIDDSETNMNYTGYKVYLSVGRPRIMTAHLGEQ